MRANVYLQISLFNSAMITIYYAQETETDVRAASFLNSTDDKINADLFDKLPEGSDANNTDLLTMFVTSAPINIARDLQNDSSVLPSVPAPTSAGITSTVPVPNPNFSNLNDAAAIASGQAVLPPTAAGQPVSSVAQQIPTLAGRGTSAGISSSNPFGNLPTQLQPAANLPGQPQVGASLPTANLPGTSVNSPLLTTLPNLSPQVPFPQQVQPGLPPSVPQLGLPTNLQTPQPGLPPNLQIPQPGLPPNLQTPQPGLPPNLQIPQPGLPTSLQTPQPGLSPNLQIPQPGLPANLQIPQPGLSSNLQTSQLRFPSYLRTSQSGLPPSLQIPQLGLPSTIQTLQPGLLSNLPSLQVPQFGLPSTIQTLQPGLPSSLPSLQAPQLGLPSTTQTLQPGLLLDPQIPTQVTRLPLQPNQVPTPAFSEPLSTSTEAALVHQNAALPSGQPTAASQFTTLQNIPGQPAQAPLLSSARTSGISFPNASQNSSLTSSVTAANPMQVPSTGQLAPTDAMQNGTIPIDSQNSPLPGTVPAAIPSLGQPMTVAGQQLPITGDGGSNTAQQIPPLSAPEVVPQVQQQSRTPSPPQSTAAPEMQSQILPNAASQTLLLPTAEAVRQNGVALPPVFWKREFNASS